MDATPGKDAIMITELTNGFRILYKVYFTSDYTTSWRGEVETLHVSLFFSCHQKDLNLLIKFFSGVQLLYVVLISTE